MRKLTAADGARYLQFVVVKGYNIEEVTKRLFTAVGHCSSLSSMNTTLERLQDRDNLETLRNDRIK